LDQSLSFGESKLKRDFSVFCCKMIEKKKDQHLIRGQGRNRQLMHGQNGRSAKTVDRRRAHRCGNSEYHRTVMGGLIGPGRCGDRFSCFVMSGSPANSASTGSVGGSCSGCIPGRRGSSAPADSPTSRLRIRFLFCNLILLSLLAPISMSFRRCGPVDIKLQGEGWTLPPKQFLFFLLDDFIKELHWIAVEFRLFIFNVPAKL
jgi:hypothetical protein